MPLNTIFLRIVLFAVGAIAPLAVFGQDVTPLSVWKGDPFKSSEWAEVITSTSSLPEIPGGRAKVSLSCVRAGDDGKTLDLSKITIGIQLSGTSFETRVKEYDRQVPYTVDEPGLCPGALFGQWVPCMQPQTEYRTEHQIDRFIDWTERFGTSQALSQSVLVDSGPQQQLYLTRDLKNFTAENGNWASQFLFGFSARQESIALKIPLGLQIVQKFLEVCKMPSPDQARLIKATADKKAAAEAAEAAREEQARTIAAQQAKLARVEAEQRRIKQQEKMDNFARYVGISSIPRCAQKISSNGDAYAIRFLTRPSAEYYEKMEGAPGSEHLTGGQSITDGIQLTAYLATNKVGEYWYQSYDEYVFFGAGGQVNMTTPLSPDGKKMVYFDEVAAGTEDILVTSSRKAASGLKLAKAMPKHWPISGYIPVDSIVFCTDSN